MKNFNLKKELIEILGKYGIKKATEIQKEMIPTILNKKDIIAQAETGSGKTLAYILPILNNLKKNSNNIKVLILVPTRELVLQIETEILKISPKEKVLSIYGGKEIAGQIEKLSENPDIIIATTGRLLDIIARNKIDLSKIQTLVLDEVDQMLEMGFKEDINTILNKCNSKRNTICVSATINSEIKKMVYRVTKNPINIAIEKDKSKLNIKQFLIETTDRRKINDLCNILNKTNPFLGIVFCRTKARVDKLEEKLSERGYSCQKIHSDIVQSKREKILKAFKNVEFQILIATDVLARGIDIKGVTHVYNYDLPEDLESYIHRIGRTGRAGENGETYIFATEKNINFVNQIYEFFENKPIQLESINTNEDIYSNIVLPDKKYNKKIKIRSKVLK